MKGKDAAISGRDESLISENSGKNNRQLGLPKASFHSANIEKIYRPPEEDEPFFPENQPLLENLEEPSLKDQILDEEELFEQILRNKSAGQLARFLSNSYWYNSFELIVHIIIGLFIINFYMQAADNFNFLFIFLLIADFLKSIVYIVVFKFYPIQFREATFFSIDLYSSISYIIIYFGIILYLAGLISVGWVSLFVLPQLVLFGRLRLQFRKTQDNWIKFLTWIRLVEPFQNAYIFLNLQFWGWGLWDLGLAYYYLFVVFLLVFSTILAILTIVFIFFVIISSKQKISDFLMLLYVGPYIFFGVWVGYVYYYLFMGLKLLLEINGFGPLAVDKSLCSQEMHMAATWMVFLAIVSFVWIQLANLFLQNWSIKYFMTTKYLNSLSRLSFDLNFGFKIMSDHYFKKRAASVRSRGASFREESEHLIARKALSECIFCYKKNADILLQPCGHAGICQKCIKALCYRSQKCPFCRENIKSARRIVYDEDNKTFVAKEEIDFVKADGS